MKKLLVLLVILSQSIFLSAQDFTFIDYSNLQTVLNPSYTGNGCGPRISMYGQSITLSNVFDPTYNTLGLNFDMPIELKNGFTLGTGYRYFNDSQGLFFNNVGHMFSVAINKEIEVSSIQHSISFAIEGGVNKRSLDINDLRWPNQIAGNGFDPNLPSGESDFDSDFVYGDLNIGLTWKTDLSDKTSVTLGSSLYHINRPDISFSSNENRIYIRTQFHAKLQTKVTDEINVSGFAYYTEHGPHDTFNLGLLGSYKLWNQNKISVGLGYVKNGQPYLTAGFDLQKISISANFGFENDAAHKRFEAIVAYRFKTCKN